MIIKSRTFEIEDEGIIDFLRRNNVDHLRFIASIDGEFVLIVKYPDYANEPVLGRQWMKISYGKKKVSIRTPSFLKPFIGKSVNVYIDDTYKEDFEAFRLTPVDFDLSKKVFGKKRKVVSTMPYFSGSGYCIIPKRYISEYVGSNIFSSRISFERTDSSTLDDGKILARIFIHDESERSRYVYSLSECVNGARAWIGGLSNMAQEFGKDLNKFKYKQTMFDSEKECNIIVFEEVEIES